MSGKVLVTGGSGFVGSHVALQLLNAGYTVRATVRSLDKASGVREMVENAGVKTDGRLSFFLFSVETRALVPMLGVARNATSAKAQRVLGWEPRSWEDAVLATAESLL